MIARRMLVVVALCWAAWPVMAEPPASEDSIDLSQVVAKMAMQGGASGKAEAKAFPDFKDVTKGMTSRKGFFTLWSYAPGEKDKDAEKLLCQVPSSILGQQFMLSTSVSGGGFFTGFPLDERVVKWEVYGKQLVLVEPETGYVLNKGKEVDDVVRRTYPDRIRVAVPIVTRSPSGDPVFDLGSLLKSSFADIGFLSRGFGPFGMFGGGGGGINSSLSKWTSKKSFPKNVEIGVALAVGQTSPPGSFSKTLVHYSFWALPKGDYKPRVADDRVGYFLTANQDWTKPNTSRDLFNRYVDRWDLRKRDPSLKLCEPVKPIVFYIEKTVPVRYRHAVRDGILEWNEAFEKVGFVNAVEVRQQTADNEWKDLDPEDMRYSFFRWIVTGAGFAMGPHRANPFTGEIYDADIIFDDSMVRFFEKSAEQFTRESALAMKMEDPALERFFMKNPQWCPPGIDFESSDSPARRNLELRNLLQQRLGSRGQMACDFIQGMKREMAFAGSMLAEAPAEKRDEFLYNVIKEVVMHEVGHTLGLRHNFIASTIYSLDEIKDRSKKGEPTTGSVMDYNPMLFLADGSYNHDFVTRTLGPYDHWAIEYGYRPFDGSYDQAAKKDGKKTGEDEDAEDESSEESGESEDASGHGGAAGASAHAGVSTSDIPPEVLAKLPPEVKKMIESGQVPAHMSGAMSMGGGAPPASGGDGGASFAAPVSGETAMLRKIASRAAEPELAYATDEDATALGADPRVNRFDCGADPIEWAKDRIALIDKRMANILKWAVKDQESWYHLRGTFASLYAQRAMTLDYVGRYIGGQYFSRSHRGDPDASVPFKVVDADKQRGALSFIEDTAFADDFFKMDAEVLNHLAASRWSHQGANASMTIDFPAHDMVGTLQWFVLINRFMPDTLRRIQDSEWKTDGSDKFTAAEYIQRLEKACWSDATNAKKLKNGTWNDSHPFISDIRRSLQRQYLTVVEPLVRQQPGAALSPDLHAMVKYSLTRLKDGLAKAVSTGKADFASQAHLVACKSRIERMLAPELTEYSGFRGSGMMFMRPQGQTSSR